MSVCPCYTSDYPAYVLVARKWIIAGIFWTSMSKQFIVLGLVAWIAMIVIALTSLPWIRKLWYGVFEVGPFSQTDYPMLIGEGLSLCGHDRSAGRTVLPCQRGGTLLVGRSILHQAACSRCTVSLPS